MPQTRRLLAVAREIQDLELLGAALLGLDLASEVAADMAAASALAAAERFRVAVICAAPGQDPLAQAGVLRRSAGSDLPLLLLTEPGWTAEGRVFPCRCAHLARPADAARLRGLLFDLLESGPEPGPARSGQTLFQGLAEILDGALILADAGDGRILEWSPRAAELFGLPPDQALDRPFPGLLEPLLEPCGLDGLPGPGDRALHEETVLRRPGRPPVQLVRSAFPGQLAGRPVLGLLFCSLAARRDRERTLGIAQRLESIGRLASGIAHEINTPIQYIGDNIRFLEQSYASMARVLRLFLACLSGVRQGEDPSPHLDSIEAAIRAADLDFLEAEIPAAITQSQEGVARVAAIVRGMKKFSHPEQEERRHVDLNQALEDALLVSRNEWKYVADVVTEFDPNLPLVSCLAGDMNQVFLNLIVNAAQAVEESLRGRGGKGRITVSTRRAGNAVEIRVGDSGVGIPRANQDKVFDPFYTTKEAGRGTGQGLAIAHNIVVDKHGGSISFTSEEGQGACFLIRLPLNEPRNGLHR